VYTNHLVGDKDNIILNGCITAAVICNFDRIKFQQIPDKFLLGKMNPISSSWSWSSSPDPELETGDGERITITITAGELEKGVESDLDLVCCLALAIVTPFPEKVDSDSDSATGTSQLTTLHYPRKVGLTPSYLVSIYCTSS
jgi:hypothetical protein